MTFNSLQYAGFFVAVFALHWGLKGRARTAFLLLASYTFYAAWDWRFVSLLAISSLIDFEVGRRIDGSDQDRVRNRWLTTSIVANLGILGFFKYWDFFISDATDVTSALGLDWTAPALRVVLPVGISFYTFQSMSYAIDIHRRTLEPCPSLLDYATFVSFFPQLVAGPIERASRLLPQIRAERRFPDGDAIGSALVLIMAGLFRKVVIADTLAPIVADGFAPGASGGAALLATYAFALQIYGDFAGYTAIARGSSRLLGVELMVNFDAPYASRSITEFWRRWHISLSTWLRDYLYVPLGGNRGSERRTERNLFLVMLIGGLWHGAAWTFVVWGALHGVMLVIHRRMMSRPGYRPWPAAVATVLTFHAVALALVFFRSSSFSEAERVLRGVFTRPLDRIDSGPLWVLVLCGLLTAGLDVVVRRTGDEAGLLRIPTVGQAATLSAMTVGILVFAGGTPVPFVYFQF